MPNTPIDNETLIKGLSDNLDQTQDMVNKSNVARFGSKPKQDVLEHDFAPKALRIKGKLIGQNELKAVQDKLGDTINELAKTYDFQNDAERSKFQMDMKKKFNQYQTQILQSGATLEQESRDRLQNAEDEDKLIGTFANSISGAVALGVMRAGKKQPLGKDPSQSKYGGNAPTTINDPSGMIDTSQPVQYVTEGYGGRAQPSPTPSVPLSPYQANSFQNSFRKATGLQQGPSTLDKFKKLFGGG